MCSWGLPTWSLWAVDSPHLFTSQTLQTQQGKPIIKSLVFRHDWSLQIRPVLAPWDCLSLSLSLSLTQCFFPQAEIKLLFNNSVESVYSQWLKDEYVRIGGGEPVRISCFYWPLKWVWGLHLKVDLSITLKFDLRPKNEVLWSEWILRQLKTDLFLPPPQSTSSILLSGLLSSYPPLGIKGIETQSSPAS